MRPVRWHIVVLCVVGLIGSPSTPRAQDLASEGTVRTAGTTANLFETLDPRQPIEGLQLELPDGWRLEHARLLRYGTERVSFTTHQSEDDDPVLIRTHRPIQGPHELVLRVQLPNSPGTYRWHLTPFIQRGSSEEADSLEASRQFLEADRVTRWVEIQAAAPRPDGENRALDVTRSSHPLFLRSQVLPPLGREQSFTLEFWLRTMELEEVILSTWNGDEAVAYPIEVVVDQSGRLRFYCGQPGEHQALRTKTPVADDQWHHVAVVYDADDTTLRLVLDGIEADAYQVRSLPPASGPIPMAIGGRIPRPMGDTTAQRLFSGHLDEVRIWGEARSVRTLRQMRTRPFAEPGEEGGRKPMRLSFDSDDEEEGIEWPEGARRVPATLSFRSPLRNLRAETDGRTVVLHWQAEVTDEGTFVVERSADGSTFTPIAHLQPEEASRSAAEATDFTYTDEDVQEQIVFYRIRRTEGEDGNQRTSTTIKIGLGANTEDSLGVELMGNRPNPFVESTTIAYEVREAQPVTLTIWNLAGHQIATLAEGTHETGHHEKTFSAENLPSGTYFARLQTQSGTQSLRMVLLR